MARVAKKAAAKKGKPGPKTAYDLASSVQTICARLATGEPMAVICRDIKVPVRTINDWRARDPAIAVQFDEARDLGFDAIAHECKEIADDGRRDYEVDGDGRVVVNHDHIQRSKLRIETRLKLLAKWDPRRYGEKLQLANHEGGELSRPTQLTEAQLLAIAAQGIKDNGTDG